MVSLMVRVRVTDTVTVSKVMVRLGLFLGFG